MRKLRYKAMAVTVALAVGAFLGAQRLQIIPGPWTKPKAGNTHMTRDQIVDAFSAAIDANPDDYMTYYRRGTQLQKQRRYEEALADLNAAIKLSPTPLSLEDLGERVNNSALPETHTLGLVVLIHTTRAEILQVMNRPEEALADLDRALSFDGRKIDTIYTRGQLRALTGRYDEAIADFDAILERRATSPWYFGRGVAKYLKADWRGAIADFQETVRRNPADNASLIWLAKAHLRAGVPMPPQLFAAVEQHSDARYVIEAFMTKFDAAQFVSSVRAGAAYGNRHGDTCGTALFIGEWLVIQKMSKAARDSFSEAEATCRPLSVERAVATAELQRLSTP